MIRHDAVCDLLAYVLGFVAGLLAVKFILRVFVRNLPPYT